MSKVKLCDWNPYDYYAVEIEHHIGQIRDLLSLNQKWLSDYLDAVIEDAERFPDEIREDMFLDDVIAAREDLPNLTYTALFLSLIIYSEKLLRSLLRWVAPPKSEKERKLRLYDVAEKLRRNSALTQRSALFDTFSFLRKLRNAVTHRAGHLTQKEQIEFSNLRSQTPFNHLSFEPTDGAIEIGSEFVEVTIDWTEVFALAVVEDLRQAYAK